MARTTNGLSYLTAIAIAGIVWQTPALSQGSAARLPIAEGAWVDANVPCGQAQSVFAYYGGRIGELTAYDGGVDGTLQPVAPARAEDGFTVARGGYEDYLHVKPLPNGRAMIRAGSVGATGRDLFSDTAVRLCAPASLPASLRAALPSQAGQAASAPDAPATPTGAQPGPAVAPLGIATGYYAEGQEACSGNGMLFYYDGRNYAWIDLSPFRPGLLTPVGQPRRVRGALALDDGAMTVASPTRFTWRDINGDIGDTEMRWCPTDQIRASARVR